jgi:hypothetical protein
MTVLTFPFRTIRARIAAAAAEIDKTMMEKRIVFGPGWPIRSPIEQTAVLVNQQTMADLQGWMTVQPEPEICQVEFTAYETVGITPHNGVVVDAPE